MSKIFELKLIEKLTIKRNKNFLPVSEAFQMLHETLVKMRTNMPNANIGFKPFLSNNEEDTLVTISFFSFDQNILETFKSIIEGSDNYKQMFFKYENRIKEINNYFKILDIKEKDFELNNCVYYKRKRLYLDSISKNKLIPHIHTVLENNDYAYDRTTMKGKIKLLIKMFDITKENVNEKYKLVQERLKKDNNEFYLQINSSSTKNKNILFSFSENEILDKNITYTVNGYGLSTEELIFPIPK